MSILDNIVKKLKSSGKSQKELCEYIGIRQQVFTDWKGNRNQSYRKYLLEIADFFQISVSELIGETDPTAQKEKDPLLEGIIEAYTACDIVGRSDIYQYAKQKAEEQRDKKSS